MKNVLESVKTTVIGFLLFLIAIWTKNDFINMQPYVMLALIVLGIVLLFAKDQIPNIIIKAVNKFLN